MIIFYFIFKDTNDIVIYIAFDPFSLLDRKFVCCGVEQQDASERLISMSIYEATTGSGIILEEIYQPLKTPTKNIVDLLHFLQKSYQSKHGDERKIHFLIDEFNQEILTTTYSTKLKETLPKFFMESTIVIALQSVSKDRTIRSVNEQDGFQTEVMDVESSGMALFELKTCIRMSSQLHQLQKDLENEIEKNDFIAPLTFKSKNSFLFLYSNHDSVYLFNC